MLTQNFTKIFLCIHYASLHDRKRLCKQANYLFLISMDRWHKLFVFIIYQEWLNFETLCSGLEMRLSRHVLKYLYIYYLPSGLFVVVSWISFLVPAEIIPGIYHIWGRSQTTLTRFFSFLTTYTPFLWYEC